MSISTSAASMSRNSSNYTANYGVNQKIQSNPIPSGMIRRCFEKGEIVHVSGNNSMLVTLRYEEETEHIEVRVDLENNEVFQLESSYERDWQEAK
jgi:invasion protein IalB